MSPKAPKCSHPGCSRPTWDVLCWQHKDPSAVAATNALLGIGGTPFQTTARVRRFASTSECWSAASSVFPDISDVVHPSSIRREVNGTVYSAVSVEAYREFPAMDIADTSARDEHAAHVGREMAEAMTPRPSDMEPEQVVELVHSSADRYGRSLEDSAAIASYGLQCEWELANLTGVKVDEDGVAYNVPLDRFLRSVEPEVHGAVVDQYTRELARFPDIIREQTGRPPADPSPVLGVEYQSDSWVPNMVPEHAPMDEEHAVNAEAERQRQEQREVRRVARNALGKAVAQEVGSILLEKGMDAMGWTEKGAERKIQRAEEREQRRYAEAQRQRDRDEAEWRGAWMHELDQREKSRRRAARRRMFR